MLYDTCDGRLRKCGIIFNVAAPSPPPGPPSPSPAGNTAAKPAEEVVFSWRLHELLYLVGHKICGIHFITFFHSDSSISYLFSVFYYDFYINVLDLDFHLKGENLLWSFLMTFHLQRIFSLQKRCDIDTTSSHTPHSRFPSWELLTPLWNTCHNL